MGAQFCLFCTLPPLSQPDGPTPVMATPNSQQTRTHSFVPAEADTTHPSAADHEGDDDADDDDERLDVEQRSSHHFGRNCLSECRFGESGVVRVEGKRGGGERRLGVVVNGVVVVVCCLVACVRVGMLLRLKES